MVGKVKGHPADRLYEVTNWLRIHECRIRHDSFIGLWYELQYSQPMRRAGSVATAFIGDDAVTLRGLLLGDADVLKAACDALGFRWQCEDGICPRGVPYDEDCGDCGDCDEGPNLLDLVKQGLTVSVAPRVVQNRCTEDNHEWYLAGGGRMECRRCGTSKPMPKSRRSKKGKRRFARYVRKVERRGSGIRNL